MYYLILAASTNEFKKVCCFKNYVIVLTFRSSSNSITVFP